jgi:hypothetical protein
MALTKVSTDGVKDDAVTTDKLANAINTERTANTAKVQTTINNNADNRVITGSGTANTLNGESALIFDGSNLGIGTNNPSGESINGSQNLVIMDTTSDGGINIKTGTSGNAQIHFSDTSGNGQGRLIYAHANDSMQIYTAGSERMRIDSSGKVGIGTTTIGEKLTIGDGDLKFYNSDEGNNHRTTFIEFQNSSNRITSESNFGSDGSSAYAAGYKFSTKNYTGSAFETVTSFVIQANGNVGIGTTSPDRLLDVIKGGTNVARFQQTTNNQGSDHACITLRHAAATSTAQGVGMVFQNTGGSDVGSIRFGSSTSYNTSSDYRLKENVTAISDGITRLKTLKPKRFNFIADAKTTVDGFLAHEVTAVPEAITGTKDEVDSDNNPIYQGIDQSKLVPLLTAALQEAVAKIEVLETKVAALEAG